MREVERPPFGSAYKTVYMQHPIPGIGYDQFVIPVQRVARRRYMDDSASNAIFILVDTFMEALRCESEEEFEAWLALQSME